MREKQELIMEMIRQHVAIQKLITRNIEKVNDDYFNSN